MVLGDTGVTTFSWMLVPSKPLGDGGLGAGWNAWHILLDRLRPHYFPQQLPYSRLVTDVILVDTTLSKDLRSLRYKLTERLVLIGRHGLDHA
jgi:hypothetical protein